VKGHSRATGLCNCSVQGFLKAICLLPEVVLIFYDFDI